MLPAAKVTVFDGKGSSFPDFEQQVRLRMRMTNMELSDRAAVLVLQQNSSARQVCSAAAGDHIANNGRVEHIADTPGNHFGPETVDAIYQEAARFLQFHRTARAIEG